MRAISSRSIRCHPPGALVLAGLFVVVGLAIPGYTQTVTSKKSSTHKKETTVTQVATAQVDSDPWIYAAPKTWTEKAYPKLIYYNRLPKGGHFAAWGQPELFSEEIRAASKSLG
jgi:hypothetical protein